MGIRPTVRGSVMNPNDHPHGGGEGKTESDVRVRPRLRVNQHLVLRQARKTKSSNKMIVRRRDGKADQIQFTRRLEPMARSIKRTIRRRKPFKEG